jgi:hypothetical protein
MFKAVGRQRAARTATPAPVSRTNFTKLLRRNLSAPDGLD